MVEVLRAEDVKEALKRHEQYETHDWEQPLVAAARAWLASQEQTPDYDAAARELDGGVQDGPFEWRVNEARRIVDAALVGFHPQKRRR